MSKIKGKRDLENKKRRSEAEILKKERAKLKSNNKKNVRKTSTPNGRSR